MTQIPKIIYRTAPTMHTSLETLYINTEIDNPGWKIKFYNDEDCLTFFKKDFSNDNQKLKNDVIFSYNKLKPGAFKADLWRLCVIYEYGGVYSDASQAFKIPIDKIIDTTKDFSIIKDIPSKISTLSKKIIVLEGLQIALFASVKKHPFLKKYIQTIIFNVRNLFYGPGTLCVTGPALAFQVAKRYNFLKDITIIGLQSNATEYCNNKGVLIVKTKKENHKKIIYGDNKAYSELWKERNIYNLSNEEKPKIESLKKYTKFRQKVKTRARVFASMW